MSNKHSLLKAFSTIGLILTLGVSMSAEAGLFGFGGTSWKEEVLLHDGSKIIVKRSQSYGGRHEIGQSGSIREQEITFTVPSTHKTLTFKCEYSEDIGGRNFQLLALHILNGTPHIVAEPVGCFAYNKWGRPNPPYVFFKHDGKEWQRIPLSEFPAVFKAINLVVSAANYDFEKTIAEQSVISAELVKKLNDIPAVPKTIMHAPFQGAEGSCSEMIHDGKGGWYGIDFFSDKPTHEACVKFCEQKKISAQYCPCEKLFKGKK